MVDTTQSIHGRWGRTRPIAFQRRCPPRPLGRPQTQPKTSEQSINLRNFSTPMFHEAVCVDFMERTLSAPVSLDCVPNALPIRQRFYRARQCCQERGDHRFDNLTFQIEGFWLSIYWCPTGTPKQHRSQLKFLGETQYCVSAHGIIQYT